MRKISKFCMCEKNFFKYACTEQKFQNSKIPVCQSESLLAFGCVAFFAFLCSLVTSSWLARVVVVDAVSLGSCAIDQLRYELKSGTKSVFVSRKSVIRQYRHIIFNWLNSTEYLETFRSAYFCQTGAMSWYGSHQFIQMWILKLTSSFDSRIGFWSTALQTFIALGILRVCSF